MPVRDHTGQSYAVRDHVGQRHRVFLMTESGLVAIDPAGFTGTVSVSPTSILLDGLNTEATFSFVEASVADASSYTWSFRNVTSGGWSIDVGQGTQRAAPRVQGVAAQTTASATLRLTVVIEGQTHTADCFLRYSHDDFR